MTQSQFNLKEGTVYAVNIRSDDFNTDDMVNYLEAKCEGCLQNAGYTAQTLDFNMELLNLCGTRERFYQVQYNFENVSTDISDSEDPVIAFF